MDWGIKLNAWLLRVAVMAGNIFQRPNWSVMS